MSKCCVFGLKLGLVAVAFALAGCGATTGGPGGAGGSAAGAGGSATAGSGGRGGVGGSATTGGSGGAGGSAGAAGSPAGGTGGAGGTGSGGTAAGGSSAGNGGSGGTAAGGSGGATGEAGAGGSGGSGGGGAGGSSGDALPPIPSDEPPLPACKRTVPVAGAGALGAALGGAMPGDCLVLADGDYAAFNVTAKATAEAPIVIRAANKLKVNVSGVLRMTDAAYVIVEGFTFPGGAGTSITATSHHCRVTRSRYFSGSAHFGGTARDNRVDHCEFGPKNNDGNLVQPTEMSENTRIDHNYLHDVSAAGGNGRETIRLGCCGVTFDNHETGNIVEHNLMVNCSGEAEMISIKASKNTVRYNTVRNSTGNITLRAGKNNLIYGNYVFGTGNQGGIRAFDSGHRIFNNYIQTGSALIGNRSGPIHAALASTIIVHNTFLGSVNLAGPGNVFSDNITSAAPTLGGAMAQGNLLADAAGLTRVGEVLSITATSKAVDAATGMYPFLMDDVNGQPRAKPDVGADEWSEAVVRYRPLTPADVGPNAP